MGLDREFVIGHPNFLTTISRFSQEMWYKEQNSTEDILNLVRTNGKSYGGFVERLVRDYLDLDPPISTEHDAMWCGFKLEIKAPRYSARGNFFIQHLKETHDFDMILVALLEPDGSYSLYMISKRLALVYSQEQRGEGRILQGGEITRHGCKIYDSSDLRRYIAQNF
jgi:hypothetical protein